MLGSAQVLVGKNDRHCSRFWRRCHTCCTGFRRIFYATCHPKGGCCWKVGLVYITVQHISHDNDRDVTDHLQLLLRKSGHHLHTTAEREVVRTIKERCCYIALNPAKEEKESQGRSEEFRLPDGNTVLVSEPSHNCTML